MSLVAFDGMPLVPVGGIWAPQIPQNVGGLSSTATLDTALEACIMYGQVWTTDGSSHTIDTSGSSALEWRTGTSTFANVGTSVTVGLAAVDSGAGSPGRAANTAGTITFDVSKTMLGNGGGITTAAWQTHVPDTGTKTIANGDILAFAIQMTTRAGADSIVVQCENSTTISNFPGTTTFDGTSTYTAQNSVPNVVITFSDGTLGFFFGSYVASVGSTTQTWNSGSGTKEYGNYFALPVPAKIYGMVLNIGFAGNTSDCDAILYSDPLGTPVAEKTSSIDANVMGSATTGRYFIRLFSSPYTSTANQPLAGILKPTTANNVNANYKTFNSSSHQKSDSLGSNCYAVNRASGAFAAQNSNKDRFGIALLVAAFEDGTATGGGLRLAGRGGLASGA